MEQPTLFYALGAVTVLAGFTDTTTAVLAWTYVALRVVHSLVQATVNRVIVRFWLFCAASLVLLAWLAVLAARAAG